MTRRLLPLWILLALGLLLIVLHLALPHLVRNYLNEKMADMGDYQGHVEDVDLAWWRGAYRVEGLLIEKKDKRVQAPLLKALLLLVPPPEPPLPPLVSLPPRPSHW